MKPYLLYVGNAYPHKNLERLASVFRHIKKTKPELSLVLVGGEDYFFERLKKNIKKSKIEGIVFPGFVPDEELDVLYREAKLYVFPSLYEGFGLPPLEALTKNTPVVSSSRTSMPEILGDLACYFNPDDKMEMIQIISKALEETSKNALDQAALIEKMKVFDWRKMAQKTKEIYIKLS